ncbi:ABC transporter substrate-binding protein [Candidatus Bipolaricaulota bacterium]
MRAKRVRARSGWRSGLVVSLVFAVGLAFLLGGAGALAGPTPGGGHLKIAFGVGIDSLNPPLVNSLVGSGAMRHILEGLTRIGSDGTLEAELAESWEVSEDGLTWVFTLRQDIKFHDGTEFNAAAVVANLDHVKDPVQNYSRKGHIKNITSYEATGPYQVAMHLSERTGDLPSRFVYHAYVMLSPKALAELGPSGIARNPVGTGPFKIEDYRPEDGILTVVRNEDYWRGPPKLERITWISIKEEGARVAALEAGEVDVALPVSAKFQPTIDAAPGLAFKISGGGRLVRMGINANIIALSDVRVREALTLAIDREGFIDAFMPGIARVPISMITDANWGTISAYDYRYDPDRARELMAEAGWSQDGNGRWVDCAGASFPALNFISYRGRTIGDAEVPQAIAAQLDEFGFVINHQELEFNTATAKSREDVNRTRDADIHLFWGSSGSVWLDASANLDGFDARYNNVNWRYLLYYAGTSWWPDMDIVKTSGDPEIRGPALARIQEAIAADHAAIPLYEIELTAGMSTELNGWWVAPNEVWWFADSWFEG